MFWIWGKNDRQPAEKPLAEKPKVDPALREFQGNDIWRIIQAGLAHYGMIMRRDGTAMISQNKFGTGGWKLIVKVDPKPDPVLDLVTDDGEIINTEDWNKLTQDERVKFVEERGARFQVKKQTSDDQPDAEL